MNPLILLYGPPGTGKTSLCQGLAQKISIRLSSTYKKTELIQIKTAALMSKYYSESAKQVRTIIHYPNWLFKNLQDILERLELDFQQLVGHPSPTSSKCSKGFWDN
jgi:AAA+ superfamily predicted ATPase